MKLFSFFVLLLVFTSCQKEMDTRVTDDLPTNEEPLIDRVVTVEGPDSMTVRFIYDAGNRLARQVTTSTVPNFNSMDDRIVRNSQGIITQIIRKRAYDQQAGIDSLVYDLYYNPAAQRYEYSRANPLSHLYTMDSTALKYDASGRIIEQEIFSHDGVTGYDPVEKINFSYDAVGNTTETKVYDRYYSPAYEWRQTFTMSYDLTKKAPYHFGNEYILINGEGPYRNMPASFTWEDEDPMLNDAYTYTTSYNSSGYPVLAVVSSQSGLPPITIKFYYR